MKRRDFIKRSLQATGGMLAASYITDQIHATSAPPTTSRGNSPASAPIQASSPVQNRYPLRPAPLLKLPVGSIQPKGWLLRQLELQIDGLNGRMPEVSDYLKYDGNGWVTPGSHIGWEELPYWLAATAT